MNVVTSGGVTRAAAMRSARWGRCPALLLLALLLTAAAPAIAIDINRADAATLAAALPGIGPVKARRIVEYRTVHGPFADLEALIDVPGIGPKTLERIRRHLHAPDGEASHAPATGRSPSTGAALPGESDAPRSTSELERRARMAVQGVVALAREEARAVRRRRSEEAQ